MQPTIRSLHRSDDYSHWHFCVRCDLGIYCKRRNCQVPEDIPMCRDCEAAEMDLDYTEEEGEGCP